MTPTPSRIQSIILADDDEDDKLIFNDIISALDTPVSIQFVSNGLRLMELLQHFSPDLLFLDLDMPYKNGLECLVEIRSRPQLENLPVVVFSSTTRGANIQTAYDMGAHLFLIKAPSFQEYSAAVKAVLQLDWKAPELIRKKYCINGRYVAFG